MARQRISSNTGPFAAVGNAGEPTLGIQAIIGLDCGRSSRWLHSFATANWFCNIAYRLRAGVPLLTEASIAWVQQAFPGTQKALPAALQKCNRQSENC